MPNYSFKDTQTNEEFERTMSISDKEAYMKANPHIEQLIYKSPLSLHSGRDLGLRKIDSGFKDVLSNIKRQYPRNTINV